MKFERYGDKAEDHLRTAKELTAIIKKLGDEVLQRRKHNLNAEMRNQEVKK